MAAPLKIELYTDVICPWCAIGSHRLDKVLAERFEGLSVEIQHHPVLLMPDTPREGRDVAAYFTQRFGKFDAASFYERPEAEARRSGLGLDLARQPRIANTIAAHTLIRGARPLGTEHRLAVALGLTHFVEIRDIADPEVLADIGAAHGFDRAQALALVRSEAELAKTLAEAQAASARGISGVPHFIFGGGIAIAGGQSEDALAEAITAALAAQGVEERAG
ncbi:DsbA family oxidoreductase [Sphingobium sp.]|uniref:DsbA family oxidoreductase n=1 Tax=Sphingobium sp. TaxID=1912891 RepID=UPI0028BF5645|nr:DsbA family oxidoreductase [Sphingobium sp.]